MGVFTPTIAPTPGIDSSLIPSGYSYFNGMWFLNVPKTETEAAAARKSNGVVFALQL